MTSCSVHLFLLEPPLFVGPPMLWSSSPSCSPLSRPLRALHSGLSGLQALFSRAARRHFPVHLARGCRRARAGDAGTPSRCLGTATTRTIHLDLENVSKNQSLQYIFHRCTTHEFWHVPMFPGNSALYRVFKTG